MSGSGVLRVEIADGQNLGFRFCLHREMEGVDTFMIGVRHAGSCSCRRLEIRAAIALR